MFRKLEISISDTYVKKLLCLFIRLWILTKAHVLMEIVNTHVGPKIEVGESSWNNAE